MPINPQPPAKLLKESNSIGVLQTLVARELGWPFYSYGKPDYGFDGVILAHTDSGIQTVLVQVKSARKIVDRLLKSKQARYPITLREAALWRNTMEPVLLILVDTRQQVAFWAEIHDQLLQDPPPSSVLLNADRRIDQAHKDELMQAVTSARAYYSSSRSVEARLREIPRGFAEIQAFQRDLAKETEAFRVPEWLKVEYEKEADKTEEDNRSVVIGIRVLLPKEAYEPPPPGVHRDVSNLPRSFARSINLGENNFVFKRLIQAARTRVHERTGTVELALLDQLAKKLGLQPGDEAVFIRCAGGAEFGKRLGFDGFVDPVARAVWTGHPFEFSGTIPFEVATQWGVRNLREIKLTLCTGTTGMDKRFSVFLRKSEAGIYRVKHAQTAVFRTPSPRSISTVKTLQDFIEIEVTKKVLFVPNGKAIVAIEHEAGHRSGSFEENRINGG
jgi:hypothetical protein